MVSMIGKAHNQCTIQLDISMSLGEELFLPCIFKYKIAPKNKYLKKHSQGFNRKCSEVGILQ